MDHYVRGWLRAGWSNCQDQIRTIVDRDDFAFFRYYWAFPPEPEQWWEYAFFGGEFRSAWLPDFRRQLELLATSVEIQLRDGGIETVTGYFHVEGDGCPDLVWEIRDRQILERPRTTD